MTLLLLRCLILITSLLGRFLTIPGDGMLILETYHQENK